MSKTFVCRFAKLDKRVVTWFSFESFLLSVSCLINKVIVIKLQSTARRLPLTSFSTGSWDCWHLEPISHRADPGNRQTYHCSQSQKTQERRCSCSSDCPNALQRGMRSPSLLHLTPCDTPSCRTALCWIVWHNVHSQQHTYMSSSCRFSRLGLSHWDPYAMRRDGCLELYHCNMVEWFWWDSSLISSTN